MNLALFDFDGTLTERDTFFDFHRSVFGTRKLSRAMLVALFAGCASMTLTRESLKENLLVSLWQGFSYQEYRNLAISYSLTKINKNIKPQAMRIFKRHIDCGDRVIIVSASLREWIEPWASEFGNIQVIATEMEQVHGVLTGHLASKNCRGVEKVHRIKAKVNLEEYDRVYAYGNSAGDKEMLALADECVYRWRFLG